MLFFLDSLFMLDLLRFAGFKNLRSPPTCRSAFIPVFVFASEFGFLVLKRDFIARCDFHRGLLVRELVCPLGLVTWFDWVRYTSSLYFVLYFIFILIYLGSCRWFPICTPFSL